MSDNKQIINNNIIDIIPNIIKKRGRPRIIKNNKIDNVIDNVCEKDNYHTQLPVENIKNIDTNNLINIIPNIIKKRGRPRIIKDVNNMEKIPTPNIQKVKEVIDTNKIIKPDLLNNQNQVKTFLIDNNSSNLYLKDLLNKQLPNIGFSKKLNYNDIKRISKFLSSSIFDPNVCCIWHGYITNELNPSRGTYINFYFNKKKIALHRLLYMNYIGEISKNEYIKFNCLNKGKCCNINHMNKYLYNNVNPLEDNINQKNNQQGVSININKTNLTIEI
jgi:hypothetical protein